MRIPVHSTWLPGHINAKQTVLIILTMVGLFLDRPHASKLETYSMNMYSLLYDNYIPFKLLYFFFKVSWRVCRYIRGCHETNRPCSASVQYIKSGFHFRIFFPPLPFPLPFSFVFFFLGLRQHIYLDL